MKTIKGLKKAVGEYRHYNKNPFSPEYAKIMFHTQTGEVWTDYFYSLGKNESKFYHDKKIINLGSAMGELHIPVTMKTVKLFIKNNYFLKENK